MTEEPKTIEVPGIPGRLREQTLDEFMSALPDPHLARTQLAEIRQMALEGMKAQHELVNLLKRIRELEDQLRFRELENQLKEGSQAAATSSVTSILGDPVTQGPVAAAGVQAPPQVAPPAKAQCPLCTSIISTRPGPWRSHMVSKHGGQIVPVPSA